MDSVVDAGEKEFPTHRFFAKDYARPASPWVGAVVSIKLLRVKLAEAVAEQEELCVDDARLLKRY